VTVTGITGAITVSGSSALAPGAQEVLTSTGGTGTLTAGSTVSLTVTQGSATQTIQTIVMSQ
jgi:hypothetical protein